MMVIAFVIVLLVLVLIVKYYINPERARQEQALEGLAKIVLALEDYKNDQGVYPANLTLLTPHYLESIPKNPSENYLHSTLNEDYAYHPYPSSSNATNYGISFCFGSDIIGCLVCGYPYKNGEYPENESVGCPDAGVKSIKGYLNY
ncbi:MAG: hypothetical protein PHG85_02390 [Candidatus Altiarchaeota archaeon]|nr:hypothetical protein [Candidatus Altiarchaeota archaeon]